MKIILPPTHIKKGKFVCFSNATISKIISQDDDRSIAIKKAKKIGAKPPILIMEGYNKARSIYVNICFD